MKINKDYLEIRRRGKFVLDRATFFKEQQSGHIVGICLIVVIIMFLIFAATCRAEVYDSEEIANAIYRAEGGHRAVKPYGILTVKCSSEKECRRVCLNTIENNFTRWQLAGSRGDFLEFLASRYAPIGACNDPHGLNRNWLNNVRYFLAKVGE